MIDRFRRDGKTVAVLDTSINHHPEIFEYQRRPQPAWHEPEEGESVILAGCTCLAGDIIGEYRFTRPPEVGDRLVFAGVGSYSLVKANRFNGINLPSVYAWDGAAGIKLMKRFSFDEFQANWTAGLIIYRLNPAIVGCRGEYIAKRYIAITLRLDDIFKPSLVCLPRGPVGNFACRRLRIQAKDR